MAVIFTFWRNLGLSWILVVLRKCFVCYTLGTSGCPEPCFQKFALANSSAIYTLFGQSTFHVAGIFILWLKAALGWVRVVLKKCFLRYTLGTSGCPKSDNTVEVFAPLPLSTYLSTMLLLNALCGHGCILRSGSLTRASQPDSNSDPAPQPQIQFQASNLARRP